MFKYGLKIFSGNAGWIKEAVSLMKSGKADFVELYCDPYSFDMENLEILRGFEVFLHVPHYKHRFNIFDISDSQIEFFKKRIVKAADFFGSKSIVLHADIGESREIFRQNVSKIYDKRILIENMPKIAPDGRFYFGYSLENLKAIHECKLGLCLDFVHAIKSAISQKKDYKKFTESLMAEFSPAYFHIYGTNLREERDEHVNFSESEFDVGWAKDILKELAQKKDIHLVFEMPKYDTLENDIKNIDFFRNL